MMRRSAQSDGQSLTHTSLLVFHQASSQRQSSYENSLTACIEFADLLSEGNVSISVGSKLYDKLFSSGHSLRTCELLSWARRSKMSQGGRRTLTATGCLWALPSQTGLRSATLACFDKLQSLGANFTQRCSCQHAESSPSRQAMLIT